MNLKVTAEWRYSQQMFTLSSKKETLFPHSHTESNFSPKQINTPQGTEEKQFIKLQSPLGNSQEK